MTARDWLQSNTTLLTNAGITSARLDCLLLLEDVTGKSRAWLLAHPETILDTTQIGLLTTRIARRYTHEPLAYIRGHAEFYGNTFVVNQHVLVPRPESEDIIDICKEYGNIESIIDIGTGSGALAISAALVHPDADVYGIDIDPACLEVATKNAQKLGARVTFVQNDLLANHDLSRYEAPVLILANLPYVPDDYPINTAATHEPALALFAGRDGLDMYRVMFDQLQEFDHIPTIVITESLESQHKKLAGIAINHGFTHETTRGLVQSFIRTV